MSWQPVSSPQSVNFVVDDIEGDDLRFFEFNGSEGHIKIHFRVFRTGMVGPNVRVRVQFDEIEVLDDKEAGSGDWRIATSVNNENCQNSPEEQWSVGSGSSADLSAFRTLTVPGTSTLAIRCRVWEEDS